MATGHFSRLFFFSILAILFVCASPSVRASLRMSESQPKPQEQVQEKKAEVIETTDIEMGSPNAPITLHEYSSLTCTHCAAFQRDIFPLIESKYIATGKVRVIFHHFPLDKKAFEAALLVSCRPQESRLQAMNSVFNNQFMWMTDNSHKELAKAAGIRESDVNACLGDEPKQNGILREHMYATDFLKVTATPTFVIGKTGSKLQTTILEGAPSFEELSALLDKELIAANSTPPTMMG